MMEENEASRFVELECLKLTENCFEWKEQARWIKLEEDIEHGSGRWSKPYVPTMSYRSIQKCKELFQNSITLLDIEVETLDDVATHICTALMNSKVMEKEFFNILKATLLARHHHHHHKHHNKHLNETNTCHREVMPAIKPQNVVDPAVDTSCTPQTITFLEDSNEKCTGHYMSSYMSDKSEASTVLVANVPYVQAPVIVFVRLVNSRILGNLNEISLPVKCLFLVLGPDDSTDEEYHVGRTIGIMMTDNDFGSLASLCQNKSDLLSGMEAFLLNSSLIPPGQWEHQLLMQSISKWRDHMKKSTKAILQRRRTTVCENRLEIGIQKKTDEDPLEKTGHVFGGLIKDMKRKLPHIRSDFTDAVNFRCLISIVLIYFSFLAPAITFAALLSRETNGLLGVAEMIAATSVSGVIFGIFAGQPLIILGATGPLLVMEESIFDLAEFIGIEFLPWRVWIGFWITVFCTIIVAFDLSYLVRKFTLFTEEVVTALISTVFIHESLKYMNREMSTYYFPNIDITIGGRYNSTECFQEEKFKVALPLMTIVLMIGTFLVCYDIRKLRHSQFFPSRLRRLVSDFGIALAVLLFQLFDIWMKDDYTTKLDIPNGFTPTTPSKRGWLIEIMGKEKRLTAWEIMLASVPAMLVTVILFMETELTGTIVDRKEYKLKKGSGYNLDLLIVGILATCCSIFGLPWMCACPVHSISHLNSLTIWNQSAPGTRPQVKKVIEQRVTNIVIHLLIGVSVVLAPLLRKIPIAVLYGVFLYLGITSLSHLRFTERIKLLFIQAKYHPDYRYIRKVRTRQIHLFTIIQLLCLVVVLGIKNSILAPTFPFFIVLMVPLQSQLKRIFTEEELEELDTDTTDDVNDENLDEYDIVHVPM